MVLVYNPAAAAFQQLGRPVNCERANEVIAALHSNTYYLTAKSSTHECNKTYVIVPN